MQTRRMATFCSGFATASAAALLAVVVATNLPGAARKPRASHGHTSLQSRRFAVQSSVVQEPPQKHRHGVIFVETVTNTGSIPMYGFLVEPLTANPSSGRSLNVPWSPTVKCRVGNFARDFADSTRGQTPNLGEGCSVQGGLRPGSSATLAFSTDFPTAGEAIASAHRDPAVLPLSRQGTLLLSL